MPRLLLQSKKRLLLLLQLRRVLPKLKAGRISPLLLRISRRLLRQLRANSDRVQSQLRANRMLLLLLKVGKRPLRLSAHRVGPLQ
jgi:hypothetical protein